MYSHQDPTPGDAAACAAVTARRRRLADNGYCPIAIINWNANDENRGKRPIGREWEKRARQKPPEAAVKPAEGHALNTGLLCDKLRVIDIDIDDVAIAAQIEAIAVGTLGEAPTRYRSNSGRVAKLYRAAAGAPSKRSLTGSQHSKENSLKVEVLGRGNQIVADGMHASGVPLEWRNGSPETVLHADLTPVTENQIDAFLTAIAPLIKPTEEELNRALRRPGAPGEKAAPGEKPMGAASDRTSILGQEAADPLRVVAAMADIPNDGPPDWERWNQIGMAIFAATGGSEAGRAAFHAWSGRNLTYNAKVTEARWQHYRASPPTQIGAGTLFHMAAEARKQASAAGGANDWRKELQRTEKGVPRPNLLNARLALAQAPEWRGRWAYTIPGKA